MTTGQADAAAAREALKRPPTSGRRGGRGRTEEPPADPGTEQAAVVPEELIQNYGEEVRTYFNELAKTRGYDLIPERAVGKIGLPAAAVAEKWGLARAVMKWPELALLMALVPYLLNVLRVEVTRWREGKTKKSEPTKTRPGPETQQPMEIAAAAQEITDARRAAPPAPHYEGASLEG